MMNLLAQYLAQAQPGLLGQMGQAQQPQFQASPTPQIPQAQTPQIQPIQYSQPGQAGAMPQMPGGVGPAMQPMGSGSSGFGSTMMNGMFGPAGSSAAALPQGADLGSMLAKGLLKLFL